MKEYLKLHTNYEAYESWINSPQFITPNVSIINGLSDVLYEPIETTTPVPETTIPIETTTPVPHPEMYSILYYEIYDTNHDLYATGEINDWDTTYTLPSNINGNVIDIYYFTKESANNNTSGTIEPGKVLSKYDALGDNNVTIRIYANEPPVIPAPTETTPPVLDPPLPPETTTPAPPADLYGKLYYEIYDTNHAFYASGLIDDWDTTYTLPSNINGNVIDIYYFTKESANNNNTSGTIEPGKVLSKYDALGDNNVTIRIYANEPPVIPAPTETITPPETTTPEPENIIPEPETTIPEPETTIPEPIS